MGSGDVPPADVAGYKVAAPEQYADVLKDWNPGEDQALQSFLANAHKAGMTQKQVDLVIGEFGRVMSQIQGQGQGQAPDPEAALQQQIEQAAAQLREVWKDEAEFERNLSTWNATGQKLAAKLGVDFEEFDKALGNNAMFGRLAVMLAKEMGEDVPQGTQSGVADVGTWEVQVAELKQQRDGLKEGDPRRQQITQQLNALYEKRYPG